MPFLSYTPTATRLVTLSESDGSERLKAATTNVSLEQLADGIKWLDDSKLDVAVDPRSVTRVQQAFFSTDDATKWSINQYGDAIQELTHTTAYASSPLLLPHGAVLTSVSVRVVAETGHGALPATMPAIHLIRHASPAHTSLGSASDSSGTPGAYESTHNITISGLSVTVDRTLYRYSVRLSGEAGANFVAGLQAFTVSCTYTIGSYDSD